MQEDDHLFIRCLTVVLLMSGGILSALMLVPPPMDPWDGVAASQQPLSPDGRRTYDVRFVSTTSRGPRATPAPIQTGEVAWQLLERLSPPPPPVVVKAAPPRPRTEPGPIVVAGPVSEMTLDDRTARTTPAAIEDVRRVVGGDGSVGGTRRPPPPPPTHVKEPVPQRLEIAAENIMAVRPVFPNSRLQVTHVTDERTQDTAEDPLPEFRRLMPRFNACARDVSRRIREPVVGKVILRFTVDERGQVRSARPVGGSLKDPDARDCLINVLLSAPVFGERDESITADRAVIFAG